MERGDMRAVFTGLLAVIVACAGLLAGAYVRVARGGRIVQVGSWQATLPGMTSAFGGRDEITLLFLGVDDHNRLSHDSPQRTDSILLTRVNLKEKRVVGLSIPRDTLVEIPGRRRPDKINAAHALGFTPLALETITRFTGVPIDYYIKTDSQGFKRMVDRVGGIWIDVEKDMDYDDSWGNLHIHLKKGYQKLNGEQAVGYVRFRHDASSDFGRMARQQKFIRAIASQVLTARNLTKLPALVQDARSAIETNMTTNDLLYLVTQLRGVPTSNMRFETVPGEARNIGGVSYVLPYERQTAELVQELFHSGSGTASAPGTVEVLNGSGRRGAARELAKRLEGYGYKVVRVANASAGGMGHPYSEVLFRTPSADGAQALADLIGAATVTPDVSQSEAPESSRRRRSHQPTDFTIILGQDYQPEEQL